MYVTTNKFKKQNHISESRSKFVCQLEIQLLIILNFYGEEKLLFTFLKTQFYLFFFYRFLYFKFFGIFSWIHNCNFREKFNKRFFSFIFVQNSVRFLRRWKLKNYEICLDFKLTSRFTLPKNFVRFPAGLKSVFLNKNLTYRKTFSFCLKFCWI